MGCSWVPTSAADHELAGVKHNIIAAAHNDLGRMVNMGEECKAADESVRYRS